MEFSGEIHNFRDNRTMDKFIFDIKVRALAGNLPDILLVLPDGVPVQSPE
jgi:hypothetical protein